MCFTFAGRCRMVAKSDTAEAGEARHTRCGLGKRSDGAVMVVGGALFDRIGPGGGKGRGQSHRVDSLCCFGWFKRELTEKYTIVHQCLKRCKWIALGWGEAGIIRDWNLVVGLQPLHSWGGELLLNLLQRNTLDCVPACDVDSASQFEPANLDARPRTRPSSAVRRHLQLKVESRQKANADAGGAPFRAIAQGLQKSISSICAHKTKVAHKSAMSAMSDCHWSTQGVGRKTNHPKPFPAANLILRTAPDDGFESGSSELLRLRSCCRQDR